MRRYTIFAAVCALTCAAFAGCSLDLDKSLIGSAGPGAAGGDTGVGGGAGSGGGLGGTAGSGNAGGTGATGATGGGGSGGVPPVEAGVDCTSDGDCEPVGCLEGRCLNDQCLYEVCPGTTTCEARSCDTSTGTCGNPQAFGFYVNSIPVGAPLGCGNNPSRCMGAMGDFVVVGTANGGLLAWRLSDPKNPVAVQVDTPPFAISRLVSSQGRILLVGPSDGGRLSLAWIDQPADPAATRLASSAVAVNFNDTISTAYTADPGSFFLVKNDPAEFYPSVNLTPPLDPNTTIALYRSSGIPTGAQVVASSGTRLVTYRTDTATPDTLAPVFSLETNAGKPSAQNAGEQNLHGETGDVPSSLSAHSFATGFEGSLLWATNRIFVSDPDAGTKQANAVVMRWPLLGGETSFNGTREVEVATYSPTSTNTPLAGPLALVDDSVAIGTVVDRANPNQTRVVGVQRSADTLELLPGSFVVPATTGSIGVSAGRRFGYVLTPNTTTPPSPPDTSLYVFSPSCS